MTNAVQYIYIYIHFIYIQLQFIGYFKLYNFICTKSFKSQIMHFSISLSFFPLSNLTYAFSAQDNESPTRSHWAAGQYIYKKKYILGWCTLSILYHWATDQYATIVRLFDSYWYTNLSLTRILKVNILLRALKSFNTIYNSIYIYIHLYANRTFSHSCNFLMQIRFIINCLKLLKTNHFKHKSICTFLSIISKIQIIS